MPSLNTILSEMFGIVPSCVILGQRCGFRWFPTLYYCFAYVFASWLYPKTVSPANQLQCVRQPAVGLDDGPADRQSHAGALRLGSEECIENFLGLFWWNSNASIHD